MTLGLMSSGTYNLLMLVVAVTGLAAAALAVVYTRRTLFPPKRQLTFSALPPASLLSSNTALAVGVEVLYEGDALVAPHVVTVTIENTGRHAVKSEEYDQDRPIDVDVGVPVKAVLKISAVPNSGDVFIHSFSGSKIHLGPDLLNTGQTLVVQALTEGRPDFNDLRGRISHHLPDTKIEYRERRSSGTSALLANMLLGALLLIFSVFLIVFILVVMMGKPITISVW